MTNRRGHTVAIVQARTSSTRLPGKVLMHLEGQPMIVRQLERVARASSLDAIVVATSEHSSDDDLVQILRNRGIDVQRGPLDDVLQRFVMTLDARSAEVVVRLTADCPLLDPTVIDQVVEAFHAGSSDYLSNTLDPTYPDGMDVEVVTAPVLRKVDELTQDPNEREHVTLGVYRRTDQFVVANFLDPSGADNSSLRWTVDNADDFAFVETVYRELHSRNPEFDYADILSLVHANPDLRRSETDNARNATLDGLNTGAMKHRGSVVEG